MSLSRELTLWLPLDAASLPEAREHVRAFLGAWGVPRPVTADVLLCLQEACKNAIRFSGSRYGMKVLVALEPEAVLCVVKDRGVGFDPATLDRLQSDPLSPSGRGLLLIGALMDEVNLRTNHGVEVRMRKRIASA